MSNRQDEIKRIIYVNSLMKEINELTDDIYEDLMDENYVALHETVAVLIVTLKDVLKSHDITQLN